MNNKKYLRWSPFSWFNEPHFKSKDSYLQRKHLFTNCIFLASKVNKKIIQKYTFKGRSCPLFARLLNCGFGFLNCFWFFVYVWMQHKVRNSLYFRHLKQTGIMMIRPDEQHSCWSSAPHKACNYGVQMALLIWTNLYKCIQMKYKHRTCGKNSAHKWAQRFGCDTPRASTAAVAAAWQVA